MAITASYLFLASMDVDAEQDALFNEVYDSEHIPHLSRVPGVLSAARFQRQAVTLIIGGQRRTVEVEGDPVYTAVYELESPEVLVSDAWAAAVDGGRWATEVRAYTHNRRQAIMRRIGPG